MRLGRVYNPTGLDWLGVHSGDLEVSLDDQTISPDK